MATIVTRSGKGSPLTNTEVDSNFTNLNTDKLELSGGTMTGNLSFGDSDKAIFGAGSDMSLFHNGNNAFLDNDTGTLFIQTDALSVKNASGTESVMLGTADGAVTLYHNNESKLATTATGIQVTGNIANASGNLTLDVAGDITLDADGADVLLKDNGVQFGKFSSAGGTDTFNIVSIGEDRAIKFFGNDGGSSVNALTLEMADGGTARFSNDIKLLDNGKAKFGTGSDLEIFHNGSNSYITDAGQGKLILSTNGTAVDVYDNTNGHTMAQFTNNAGVSLAYQGSTKIATTSTGVDVTGNATFADNGKAIFGASSDLQIYHDGSNSYIREFGAGDLKIQAINVQIENSSGVKMFRGVSGGEAILYHNNALKLATTATGIDVTGTAVTDGLTVDGESALNSNVTIKSTATGASAGPYLNIFRDSSSPADNDFGGIIQFNGKNSAGQTVAYSTIVSRLIDVTDGTEDSRLDLQSIVAGTNRSIMQYENGLIQFNAAGQDIDFKVHSDNRTNALFVDAAADAVKFDAIVLHDSDNGNQQFIITRQGSSDQSGRMYVDDAAFVFNSTQDEAAGASFVFRSSNATVTNQNLLELVPNAEAIFNQDSADVDFRVESNNYDSAFFVDGGADDIRMGGNHTAPWGQTSGLGTFQYKIAEHSAQIATDSATGFANLYLNKFNISSDDTRMIAFYADGSAVGTIQGSTSGITYNTTSDRRLKDNIEPIADATDKLMSMKPVTHTWIANPEAPSVHGFIAQEMQEVVPEAVSGEDGGEEMMSMDYGRITPVLVAALQEATNEIKALKKRVSELEAI